MIKISKIFFKSFFPFSVIAFWSMFDPFLNIFNFHHIFNDFSQVWSILQDVIFSASTEVSCDSCEEQISPSETIQCQMSVVGFCDFIQNVNEEWNVSLVEDFLLFLFKFWILFVENLADFWKYEIKGKNFVNSRKIA